MPMDYVFSTLAMGFKVSTLIMGAMFFSGGMWAQALSTGQQEGAERKGYAALPGTRYMTFWSDVKQLVAEDVNPLSDVFVHDHISDVTERVSVDSDGNPGNGDSRNAAISDNGRFVAFESESDNLVFADHNGHSDIFLHDRESGITTRVSVDDAGFEANGDSIAPVISRDGRYVAFESGATNLQRGVTASGWGVYVHDRLTMTTFRAHLNIAGPAAVESGYRRINDVVLLDDHTIALEVDLGDGRFNVPVRVDAAGWQRSAAT